MIEHRNYSRQFLQYYARHVAGRYSLSAREEWAQMLARAAALVERSQKFTLPDGGIAVEDFEFRALEREGALRLPFPVVALEYYDKDEEDQAKRILIVEELEDGLYVSPIVFMGGACHPAAPFGIKNGDFINDQRKDEKGHSLVKVQPYQGKSEFVPGGHTIAVVLSFVNALSCSNVIVERGPAPKQGAKLKNSLPFDTYHTLVLRPPKNASESTGFGTGRSPREHLRRGHIRRLESGTKVWVNATVVNAGAPGKVVKDYKL